MCSLTIYIPVQESRCFNFTYFSLNIFSVCFCVELQISDVIQRIKDNLKFITAELIEEIEVFELFFFSSFHCTF